MVAATLTAAAISPGLASAARALITPASSGRPDVRIDLRPVFDRILYSHPAALVRDVTADGANGVNALWERGKGPGMFIEEQRHGEEAIIAGVVHHQPRLWKRGVREFAWGFAHQGPAGNFPDTNDPFHSTSFFVEGTAHLILVLRGAASDGIAIPRRLLREVGSFLPSLHRAARWMASRRVWQAGLTGDAPYTHRRFLVASALGLTAVLTGDERLARRAREALEMGLSAQRSDGVFPELGGFDSSYQARGIVYAQQYLAWVRHAPRSLGRAIARGLAWERTRILPSGEVSTVGNTRANGVMHDHNGVKRVVYPMVATALAWWGLARHRPDDVRVARRVSKWGEVHPAAVGT
ncbi:MAG TPA: hypothetical protein VG405_07310 [Solirubrobacteraceae bacterium]|nr:hypothetical protein [Solirubrobacteraceae bacterium]